MAAEEEKYVEEEERKKNVENNVLGAVAAADDSVVVAGAVLADFAGVVAAADAFAAISRLEEDEKIDQTVRADGVDYHLKKMWP